MSAFGEAYRKLIGTSSVREIIEIDRERTDPTCTICGLRKSTHREMGTPLRLWCPPRETQFSSQASGGTVDGG